MSTENLIELTDGFINDTPGFYRMEKRQYIDVQDFFIQCMGSKKFNEIKEYFETVVTNLK
jgi:hypothetical protein